MSLLVSDPESIPVTIQRVSPRVVLELAEAAALFALLQLEQRGPLDLSPDMSRRLSCFVEWLPSDTQEPLQRLGEALGGLDQRS